jgi:hypothetical protein
MSEKDIKRIRKLGWAGLESLWSGIRAGTTPGWRAGAAFEYLVIRAFELDGADVVWPYSVPVGGEVVEQIDGAVHVDGLSCLVESKHFAGPVNVGPIAKLRSQLLRRPSHAVGLLFSVSGFTTPALTLAQYMAAQNILLWNPEELTHLLSVRGFRRALQVKYRRCVEMGIPDYDVRAELVL